MPYVHSGKLRVNCNNCPFSIGQPPLLIHSVARGQASAFGDSMDLQLGDGDPSSGSPSLDNGSLSASNPIVELGDSSVMERPSSSLSDRDPRISICL
ncbi:hypothetical protein Q3G72_033939 [Acer saccharum]|nr:hypothetical protein Q3G72_033939 [Acer saccharum]